MLGAEPAPQAVSPPAEDPTDHGLPVLFLEQDSSILRGVGCVCLCLGLSHSAVAVITPMCACTHKQKLNLNSLNSLTRCLKTMEHGVSYLHAQLEIGLRLVSSSQPHTSLLQAHDGSWKRTVGTPNLFFRCSRVRKSHSGGFIDVSCT